MNWKINNQLLFEREKLNFLKIWWLNIDKVILGMVLFLIFFGVFMNLISTPAISKKIDTDPLFFFKKHIILAVISVFLLIFVSFLDIKKFKFFIQPIFISILLLLIITLIFSSEIKGSKRWISIFGMTLQPSEFAKITFIMFNAYILEKLHQSKFYIKYFASSICCFSLVILLILQPDFGMSFIIILLWSVQLFLFGLPWTAVFMISLLMISGMISAYIFLPHVKDRILRFFDIENNYQVQRSIDAYINGGFFGTGPGNGLVKNHIPDAHTDFIFAVITEEVGLIMSIVIITIFIILITRLIKKNMIDDGYFTYLTIAGITTQYAFQTIINIGVSLAMLPTKGMTLPFISYGGSSLISMSIAFGVILSLTKKSYKTDIKNYELLISK